MILVQKWMILMIYMCIIRKLQDFFEILMWKHENRCIPIKILEARFTQDPPLVDLLLEAAHGFSHQIHMVLTGTLPVHCTRFGNSEDFWLGNLISRSFLKPWLSENYKEKNKNFSDWKIKNNYQTVVYTVLVFQILITTNNTSSFEFLCYTFAIKSYD